MPVTVLDGLSKHRKLLLEFYTFDMAEALLRRGLTLPPLSEVNTQAPPAIAYVNPLPNGTTRWIAECPDCEAAGLTRAEYVWIETPLFFCCHCGNRAIGGSWRNVELPAERLEIEALLLARPDPSTRAWGPHMTLDDLRAENAQLVGGGS